MLVAAVIRLEKTVHSRLLPGRVEETFRRQPLGFVLLLLGLSSCAARADLVPGPGQGSLDCQTEENRLVIEVLNQGGKASRATTTLLLYGDRPPIHLPTRPIRPGGSETLTATLPDECLWAECSFEVQVDSRGEVTEKEEGNNRLRGQCFRVGRTPAHRP